MTDAQVWLATLALPYMYLVARVVGAGWFQAKLAHHRRIIAEHKLLGGYQHEEESKHG